MDFYAVRVFEGGEQRALAYRVPARSAEHAVTQVAAHFGLEPTSLSVDKDTGKMTLENWHGYEFRAKKLQSQVKLPTTGTRH